MMISQVSLLSPILCLIPNVQLEIKRGLSSSTLGVVHLQFLKNQTME